MRRVLPLLLPASIWAAACDSPPPSAPRGAPKPAAGEGKDQAPAKAPAGEVPTAPTAEAPPTANQDVPPPTPSADPVPIAPTSPHTFGVLDLLGMDRISDPQVSPDGNTIVFVRRVTDLAANRARTDLWSVPAAGGEPTRLTEAPESDDSPRFSPDGATIYFVSGRSGSPQLWSMPAAGGAATQVTDLPLPVSSPVVSPMGDRIAFSMDVFVDCADLPCTKQRLDAAAAADSGKVYDRLFARHWDTWSDGRRAHIFVHTLGGTAPVDVTKGLDADAPSKPFGGSEEFAFSPDGTMLVFTARNVGAEEAWSTNFDLFSVPVDGSSPPKNLTAANPAWDTHPLFSADGKTLVYKAMTRPGYEADRFRIVTMPFPEGTPAVLTEAWDRSPDEIALSPDGTKIFATADDLGHHALFSVALADGAATRIVDGGTVHAIRPTKDGVVFTYEDLRHPAELHSVAATGGERTALTKINGAKVAVARTGAPEQWTFKGAGGDPVHAYVVKPVDFDATRLYPVAFLVHGGPQGSFGDHFHYRWNPQVYAGAGYAVIMIDFHGSTGYGQAFTDAIQGDWGGKPKKDLMLGLADAIHRFTFLDGDRVCALGASYGGFMMNWLAGTEPERFRCFVNHDGVFDQRAMYYETEELWFPEWEQGGTAYDLAAAYEKWNPVQHAGKWRTPMLVVHGGLDYRIPDTQGLMAFTALQRRAIPSRLLYFPDENHWVLKPKNSQRWHQEVLAWLDRWLGSEADAPSP